MKELAKLNEKKYLYPPTWEMIKQFVTELGVSYQKFEAFYGIHDNCLPQIKTGKKQLPTYAWHVVYEKIKPTYGIGFLEEHTQTERINAKLKHRSKKKKLKPINTYTHNRLSDVK